MLFPILLGLLLAMVTIAVHAACTSVLIELLQKNVHVFKGRWGQIAALSATAIGLLIAHILETAIWALVYILVIGKEQFEDFEAAVYFSTVTFTTLGYGDIVIEGHWRMLSACQAMIGVLVFGWSTALLFAVVRRTMQARNEEKISGNQ